MRRRRSRTAQTNRDAVLVVLKAGKAAALGRKEKAETAAIVEDVLRR
jgi:hypothetical protein